MVLSALLVICLVLFFESRIEAFAPQIKNFAVLKIEETFSGRFKLSIGSLDGGILHPIVLNDIKIKDKHGVSLFSSLNISSIKTNYRIWDILFKRRENSIVSQILAKDSRVYINFVAKNNKVSGFVRIDGDLENSRLKGYVNLADNERIDFEGGVKGDRFDVGIKLAGGSLNAKGSISEAGTLEVSFRANHLNIRGLDISGSALLENRIADDGIAGSGHVEGKFETKNLIVNYNPFLDLKISYRIASGVLEIQELNLGGSFNGRGRICLKQPFITDATVLADNLSLSWLFSRLGAKEAASVLSGTMNAKLELKGPIRNLKSNIRLEIRKGTILKLDFDYLNANLKGDGPILRIEDSRVTRESGYFALAGEMDLRRMGRAILFDSIRLSSDDRAITWDGWNTKRVQDVEELSMKKKINDDIDLNFKKFITDEKVDESLKDTDEVQFEYKLHPNNSLTMMVGHHEDFFGFEHKDKF